ncbi:MAG TPA: small multi-drug export protein [Gillisia sp.]|nr:small multi-drug export protein [Gillisia sp.]
MLNDIITAMLWSISPFGEAKVGIPYALVNNVNYYVTFTVCFAANVMVFPVMQFFLNNINKYLLKYRFYKKSAIYVARKAKVGAGKNVQKYGFYGLLLFVMVPIPGTGVYAGTIAAWILGLERKRAFVAITIGIYLSCVIVWTITVLSLQAME